MILLRCAKLPERSGRSDLARLVRSKLPHKSNDDYISTLESKTNPLSACESLYALNLLCDMIQQLPIKTDPSTLVLARGKFGKPYFVDSALRFNISHSRGVIVCALSDSDEVGVDVEASVPNGDRAKKIAERFLSPQDIQSVDGDRDSFARIWSENEAEAKFFGESLTKFLQNKRNSDPNEKNSSSEHDLAIHRFRFGNIPVTLCTSRVFSTIFFNCQP